ncbi:MAG: SGNH/GDSL hydrolase family protein [Myxococcota bacterium]
MFGKILLTVGATLATLVVLELVLSALFEPVHRVWQVREIFELDDELIYALRPNRERVRETDEFVERVTTNAHGLRDTDIAPREAFEQRVIVLGDSMVFGHGVGNEEAFPNQLEALFRERGRRVDVINAGVKGYGTDNSYKFYTHRLAPLGLEPDLLIFAIYHNDLNDNIGQPLYTIENGALVPLDPTRNWITLLGSIEARTPEIVRNRILYGLVLSRFVGRDVYSLLPDLDQPGLVDWAARKAVLEVLDLERRGRAEGFRVLVLCVPYRDGKPGFYSWLGPLRDRGTWVFDASQEPIWGIEKDRLFFPSDYHLTAEGNRELAETVYRDLERAEF